MIENNIQIIIENLIKWQLKLLISNPNYLKNKLIDNLSKKEAKELWVFITQ